MAVFDQGGGGGKAGTNPDDLAFILSKPYDLYGLSQETLDQINQMFEELYRALRQTTQINTQTLLGRYAAAAGQQQQITLGSNLTLSSAGVLSASGGLSTATLDITNAQLGALFTTPLKIVAAPGANKAVMPLWWSVDVTKSIASGGPSPALRVRHDTQSTDLAATLVLDLANAPRSFFAWGENTTPAAGGISSTSSAKTNLGLKISGSSDDIGVSDATLFVTVVYITIDTEW